MCVQNCPHPASHPRSSGKVLSRIEHVLLGGQQISAGRGHLHVRSFPIACGEATQDEGLTESLWLSTSSKCWHSLWGSSCVVGQRLHRAPRLILPVRLNLFRAGLFACRVAIWVQGVGGPSSGSSAYEVVTTHPSFLWQGLATNETWCVRSVCQAQPHVRSLPIACLTSSGTVTFVL